MVKLRSKKEDVKPSTYDKYEIIVNNYLISFFDNNSSFKQERLYHKLLDENTV